MHRKIPRNPISLSRTPGVMFRVWSDIGKFPSSKGCEWPRYSGSFGDIFLGGEEGEKRGGLEGLNLRIAIGLPGKWLVWVLYVSIVYMLAYWIDKYRSYCVFYELAGKLWHSSGPCLRPLRWSCLKSWRRLKSPWSALRGHIWKVSLKACRRCPALSPLFCLWWMVEMPHWQKNCKVSGLMIFGASHVFVVKPCSVNWWRKFGILQDLFVWMRYWYPRILLLDGLQGCFANNLHKTRHMDVFHPLPLGWEWPDVASDMGFGWVMWQKWAETHVMRY